MIINKEAYNTEEKKIGFVLSLMNEGEAGTWKEQFIQATYNAATIDDTPMTFGTFDYFLCDLKAMFQPHNDPADALTHLRALQYNLGENINEHITRFKMTLAQTKLDKSNDSQATIVFFKETLSPRLIQRILGAENVPETLSGWYKKAAFQEQNWQEIQRIFGKTIQNKNNNTTPRKFNFQIQQDPNAMDIDVLMAEQRTELMRKGACFNCKAVGHLS